jgi:AcrR family transcriptional regulator
VTGGCAPAGLVASIERSHRTYLWSIEVDRVRPEPDRSLTEVIGSYRRTQLVDAATRLFTDRGFDAVSMEEIAAEAGMARSTAYIHFPNRESLIDACLEKATIEVAERLALIYGEESDARRRFTLLVGVLLRQADEWHEFYRFATQGRPPDLGATSRGDIPLIGPLSEGFLADALADCLGRGTTSDELSLVLSQVHGAMAIRAAGSRCSATSPNAVAISEFVLRGLTPATQYASESRI